MKIVLLENLSHTVFIVQFDAVAYMCHCVVRCSGLDVSYVVRSSDLHVSLVLVRCSGLDVSYVVRSSDLHVSLVLVRCSGPRKRV